MLEPGTVLVGQAGQYKVLTLLAQGGMPSIHLARTQGEPALPEPLKRLN
jgi:hypothetical protein